RGRRDAGVALHPAPERRAVLEQEEQAERGERQERRERGELLDALGDPAEEELAERGGRRRGVALRVRRARVAHPEILEPVRKLVGRAVQVRGDVARLAGGSPWDGAA